MGRIHVDGPGLRELGTERNYGRGCCGICGDWGDALVPRIVRYWSPDDGWLVGVLCLACAGYCRSRGPREGDYAYRAADPGLVDAIAAVVGDDGDALISMSEDL